MLARSKGRARAGAGRTRAVATERVVQLIEIVLGAATIAALMLAAYAFRPRLSFTSEEHVQPASALATIFYLSNQATLGANNVRLVYFLDRVESEGHNVLENCGVVGETVAARLESDQRVAVTCGQAVRMGAIVSADISIQAEFRPDWWLWRQRRIQRFVGSRSGERFRWYPAADQRRRT